MMISASIVQQIMQKIVPVEGQGGVTVVHVLTLPPISTATDIRVNVIFGGLDGAR